MCCFPPFVPSLFDWGGWNVVPSSRAPAACIRNFCYFVRPMHPPCGTSISKTSDIISVKEPSG
jgi:hypothetical protein